ANVIESRETTKWVRELVGTTTGAAASSDAVTGAIFQAVIGTSRLPLTSLESPLPAFSLGRLAYIVQPRESVPKNEPLRTWRQFVDVLPSEWRLLTSTPKHLEALIRMVPATDLPRAADCWTALIQRCTRDHLIRSRPRIATGDNLDFISKSNGQVKLFS